MKIIKFPNGESVEVEHPQEIELAESESVNWSELFNQRPAHTATMIPVIIPHEVIATMQIYMSARSKIYLRLQSDHNQKIAIDIPDAKQVLKDNNLLSGHKRGSLVDMHMNSPPYPWMLRHRSG